MFTKEEGLWIALHCEDESPTKLKRKFCKVFNVPRKRAASLKGLHFTRYKENFVKKLPTVWFRILEAIHNPKWKER